MVKYGNWNMKAYRTVSDLFELRAAQRTKLDTSPFYQAILTATGEEDWITVKALLEDAGILPLVDDDDLFDVDSKSPVSVIEYGLYSLLKTGRCTEEQIQPAKAWLESAQECIEANDWRPDS